MAARDRSARDTAYLALRSQIMTMRVAPGEKVNEVELAKGIGASRTPVREALSQLAAEGLIVMGRGGGYYVAGIDIAECRSLFEALLLVARSTARLLIANAPDEKLHLLHEATERFDEAVEAFDPALISQRNYELHTLECRLGGNSYITMLGERVHSHAQRLAFMSFSAAGKFGHPDLSTYYGSVCDDHWDQLQAIERRDLETAERIAVRHVQLFRSRVIDYFSTDALADIDLGGFPTGG
ncbi:GntR family transcriptional regulator [Gulosibacter sp. 10]|uniref:GntR family transcriptional regulator n=1 Tax=Gulosibacter sp. 10 TaxID=1255570 RepID=UPI00097EF50A|nr:GntR family transcriptional regulator [Gulosibacter sp. 10]SJM67743.1 Transcriptional regulator, GntR family [Gulosibacter sp. 10]